MGAAWQPLIDGVGHNTPTCLYCSLFFLSPILDSGSSSVCIVVSVAQGEPLQMQQCQEGNELSPYQVQGGSLRGAN